MSSATGNFAPQVPIERAVSDLVVRKSRFISWACPAKDRAQALAWLEQARREHPDAGHYCWAYHIGCGGRSLAVAMSDDGEPSGTAGKPILSVVQHSGIVDLMVIVIRYFGGIKLGTGGLVRAYSQATRLAVDALVLIRHQPMLQFAVQCAYPEEQHIKHWLQQHEGEVLAADYTEQISLIIEIPEEQSTQWRGFLAQRQLTAKNVASD